jgi:hypothetical protein
MKTLHAKSIKRCHFGHRLGLGFYTVRRWVGRHYFYRRVAYCSKACCLRHSDELLQGKKDERAVKDAYWSHFFRPP